jgi:hypothetical protein
MSLPLTPTPSPWSLPPIPPSLLPPTPTLISRFLYAAAAATAFLNCCFHVLRQRRLMSLCRCCCRYALFSVAAADFVLLLLLLSPQPRLPPPPGSGTDMGLRLWPGAAGFIMAPCYVTPRSPDTPAPGAPPFTLNLYVMVRWGACDSMITWIKAATKNCYSS